MAYGRGGGAKVSWQTVVHGRGSRGSDVYAAAGPFMFWCFVFAFGFEIVFAFFPNSESYRVLVGKKGEKA